MFDLPSDGVLRSFDGPYKHNVIEAIGLSPIQIKELLDIQPWSKEIEDRFRGVDGRKVKDIQALFEPPLDSKLTKHTEESLAELKAEGTDGEGWAGGVNITEKYACSRAVSNYDLSSRKET